MANQTSILSQLQADKPLVQDANYRFNEQERQYVDNQILGCQQLIVTLLANGKIGTYYDVDGGSPPLVIGDVVCSSSTGIQTARGVVTRASAADVDNATCVVGIALSAANPGGTVIVAESGIIPPGVTDLPTTGNGYCFVDLTTGRCVYSASPPSPTDCYIGGIDTVGNLTLAIIPPNLLGVVGIENDSGAVVLTTTDTFNRGTDDGEALTREGAVNTTNSADHPIASYPVPSNGAAILDIEIVAVLSDYSIMGWWKKSLSLLNTAGTPTIGTERDIDSEFVGGSPAWFLTMNGDGSGFSITVNSQGDDVEWYIVGSRLQVIHS